jgi:hypothetical protein
MNAQQTRDRIVDLNQLSIAVELGSYSCSLLYWGYLGQSWWRNHPHMHSFYEACYAFSGRGVFRINNREHAISAGNQVYTFSATIIDQCLHHSADALPA